LTTWKGEIRVMPAVSWQSSTRIALLNEVEINIRIYFQVKASSMASERRTNCAGDEQRSLLRA
jgi:hypothetical protein